jgi:hypothetical protein
MFTKSPAPESALDCLSIFEKLEMSERQNAIPASNPLTAQGLPSMSPGAAAGSCKGKILMPQGLSSMPPGAATGSCKEYMNN